jgi:putative DNA primase/helicase
MIAIATGKSRTDVKWKNINTSWDKLKARLKETRRTPETVAEYMVMPQSQQGEIKDVGGFVGGVLLGDRRTARNIGARSIVALDLDYAETDALMVIDAVLGCAWAVYSTHKHTPQKPRLRLLVPLKRPATPDEYEPIARWIASEVGIEQCDESTYDPARLMYWPSTSADGEYIFAEGGRDFLLDPDLVLRSYPDWRNPIHWPTAEREARAVKATLAKLEDPGAKPGTIGAFCRCYGVAEAMAEFLPGIYDEAGAGRYTFVGGSTVGGALVFENKWMHSYHGTDPAGGQHCNAFDLVRIHKFGELDKDVSADTKVNRLPSYDAMLTWAVTLDAVKTELTSEKSAEIQMDFDGVDWATKLERTKSGALKGSIDNVAIILLNSPDFRAKQGYNTMSGNIEVLAEMPWDVNGGTYPRIWNDMDDACLRHYLERVHNLSGKELIYDGVTVALKHLEYHPVRQYLANLPAWDGVERVDTLLMTYFDAKDCPEYRMVTRKTLLGAIHRVLHPGCKFDEVLVLQGKQGIGKSTLWRRLAGDGRWFTDSVRSLESSKDSFEQIRGIWIAELGEMQATKKVEIEAQKAFLSSQVDRYRPAYARRVSDQPRQCIFVGTTNEAEFLRDRTGNRRYWTVKLGHVSRVWVLDQATVDQIWAETLRLYHKGEKPYLGAEWFDRVNGLQEDFVEDDGMVGMIDEYLETKVPTRWKEMDLVEKRDFLRGFRAEGEELEPIHTICALEISALVFNDERPNASRVRDIKAAMRKNLEWFESDRENAGKPWGRQRVFVRRPVRKPCPPRATGTSD